MELLLLRSLHSGCAVNKWRECGELECKIFRSKLFTLAATQFCDRNKGKWRSEEREKQTHPPVVKSLSSSCFPRKKARRFWIHSPLQSRDRDGAFHPLREELKLCQGQFRTHFRLSLGQLRHIYRCQDRAATIGRVLTQSSVLKSVWGGWVVALVEDRTLVAYNHHDWMMRLFVVRKFGETKLHSKTKRVAF